jgi:S1-C subfamily serine protease
MSELLTDKHTADGADQHSPIHVLRNELPWERPSPQGAAAGSSGTDEHGAVSGVSLEMPNQLPIVPDATTGRVYDLTRAGVVHIEQKHSDARTDGSGFVLDRSGHVATDAHAVLPHKGILPELTVVTEDGRELPARIEKLDLKHDLAILQVDGLGNKVEPLPLGDDGKAGDRAWALGHPQGVDELYISPGMNYGKTTSGQLDAERYFANFGPSDCADDAFARFMQLPSSPSYANSTETSSHMHTESGNSGGPVVDENGKVTDLVARGSDTPGVTNSTPVSALKDLIAAKPAYTFAYKPDPDHPGYQILESIVNPDGTPLDHPHVVDGYVYMFQQCQRPKLHEQIMGD